MSKTVLIVESPNKIKKLNELLGGEYKVMASVGHIRDLPQKSMGVEAPDYKPMYEITKPDVVQKLKDAAKGNEVILATDPDREGEAISFHLMEVLGLKDPKRVTFHEITEKAVRDAIQNPRQLDAKLVLAQEARRVLDRLVGYRVSSSLSNATGQKLSAGRVQTPAVRIVVDRERQIQAFKITDFLSVKVLFKTDSIEWAAEWSYKPLLPEGSEYWTDRPFAERVSQLRAFEVTNIQTQNKNRMPPAPFTTSTLQQAASISLKMSPELTMNHAQELFAAGLITYHRTDTPNLSQEAIEAIWSYLRAEDMAEFIPEKRNVWKAKEGAQEAHEAIRPTHFEEKTPEIANPQAESLYRLIWLRAVASQMKDEVQAVPTINLVSGLDGKQIELIAVGRVQIFGGWRILVESDAAEEPQEEIGVQSLPSISKGQTLTPVEGCVVNKKTKPPARYSKASLIKELENQGIGRPSTYASIMKTIEARGYVNETNGRLVPTELGSKVIDALAGKFGFADLTYTRQVEEDFDRIAQGQAKFRDVVAAADNQLTNEIGKLELVTGSHPCPACGGQMRRKKSVTGFFWGCSNYPECKQTMQDKSGEPNTEVYPCPKCQKPMRKLIAKNGKNAGKPFWSCSGYPNCKHSADDHRGKPKKQ